MQARARKTQVANWGLRFLGGLAGLVLAATLAELVLRIGGLAPTGGVATVTVTQFQRIPGLFSPGQHLVDRVERSLPYDVTIDSLGYRGTDEFTREKPAGEVRVLMLGDSFTFGYLVSDDSTLPVQVADGLRARCKAPIRVINAGVGGSTIVTAAHMAERAAPLGIDVAVLTFTENDVGDLAHPIWYQLEANRLTKSRFPMSVIYPIARHLALWNLLLKAQATWEVNRRAPVPALDTSHSVSRATPIDLQADYAQRLRRLRDDLSRSGVSLVFAVYPSQHTVYNKSGGELVAWVDSLAHSLGLTTVNLTATLRADGRGERELYLLPVDGHPSAAGYHVVAPAIVNALLALPALVKRCEVQSPSSPSY